MESKSTCRSQRVRFLGWCVLACWGVLPGTSSLQAQGMQISPLSWDYSDATVGTLETATFGLDGPGSTSVMTYRISLNETPVDDMPYVLPDDPYGPSWSLGASFYSRSTWVSQPKPIPVGEYFMADMIFAPTSPRYNSAYLGIMGYDACVPSEQEMFLALQDTGLPSRVPLAILLSALGMGMAGWLWWRWRSRRLRRRSLRRRQIASSVDGWLLMK